MRICWRAGLLQQLAAQLGGGPSGTGKPVVFHRIGHEEQARVRHTRLEIELSVQGPDAQKGVYAPKQPAEVGKLDFSRETAGRIMTRVELAAEQHGQAQPPSGLDDSQAPRIGPAVHPDGIEIPRAQQTGDITAPYAVDLGGRRMRQVLEIEPFGERRVPLDVPVEASVAITPHRKITGKEHLKLYILRQAQTSQQRRLILDGMRNKIGQSDFGLTQGIH